MSDARPLPQPDDTSAFFWEGARAGRLLVQRCDRCALFQYPPEVVCIHCQSTELTPTEVSGRGRLWSYTVVERVFDAGFTDAVPYALALVELDEQTGLNMLTNVVGVPLDDLEVGMPLEVVFEDRGEVVMPQFGPAREVACSSLTRDVAVAGVGYSPISRQGAPDPRLMTLTAVNEALADAGLAGADVDGIFEYKFGPESPGAQDVARLIGCPDLAAFADIMPTNPSGLAGPLAAVMAVASGACETALAFRCLTRESGHTGGVRAGPERVGGSAEFVTPYGYGGGIIMLMAMAKQRWMAQYGRTEADFGRIAVNARRWSADNPRAVLRDPITMDDYLDSRMIADPLRLLDCDYPVNGAVATIVTTAERGRDLRSQPVLVDAMSYGTGAKVDWLFPDDLLYGGTRTCAERLWARSSFGPGDVDVAQLYDGFTNVTVQWIESLGFCGFGEYGDWIGDGSRIAPGGDLPTNTVGGQLAEGRLHGVSFLNEAVLQLRGECAERQVPDARVAVVASGLYIQAGAMVLTLP